MTWANCWEIIMRTTVPLHMATFNLNFNAILMINHKHGMMIVRDKQCIISFIHQPSRIRPSSWPPPPA